MTRTETATPSEMPRTPTLADVAALAGVSPATVSRVIGRGKGFDRMCGPVHGGNALNGDSPSGALANARCPGTGSRPVPPVAAERLSGGTRRGEDPPSPCRRPSPPVPYAPEA
ncbi:LacI family DNA-binding transcriptional regulator [Actinoallomurus iriomotensis]|uniref:HTH lacI-type domain-containing protein n=1 Tax=Actinoallomurus iriomotensis TaxID=478107 RepID=A0A9W6RUG7_9ACTN|nr:LacI family DNA-binding transcriptional regulator [Actinoallomurus iriomotensis]GLY82081.1 hypothetical protein Airi02_000130 [Actinoallomurus iriomotensis]